MSRQSRAREKPKTTERSVLILLPLSLLLLSVQPLVTDFGLGQASPRKERLVSSERCRAVVQGGYAV